MHSLSIYELWIHESDDVFALYMGFDCWNVIDYECMWILHNFCIIHKSILLWIRLHIRHTYVRMQLILNFLFVVVVVFVATSSNRRHTSSSTISILRSSVKIWWRHHFFKSNIRLHLQISKMKSSLKWFFSKKLYIKCFQKWYQ